jgi:hypothetical protein
MSNDSVESPVTVTLVPGSECRVATNLASPAFFSPLMDDPVGCLLGGDEHEKPPETFPVSELGEAAASGTEAQAAKSALGDVMFVGHPPKRVPQLPSREPYEPITVAFPEFLGRPVISAFEPIEQE